MRSHNLFKTTGKRWGILERLGDGLRGARGGWAEGTSHHRAAAIAPQSIPTPQPTSEMASRPCNPLGGAVGGAA